MSTEADTTRAGWQELSGITAAGPFPSRAKLGGESIIVVDTGNGLRGIERACPHQKATMMDASIMGGGKMIRCAAHNYTFKLADGKGVNCPGFKLRTFEIKEEGGAFFGREVTAP